MVKCIMGETRAVPTMLERQNKKLSILYEIALTVSKSLDLKGILANSQKMAEVLRVVRKVTNVTSGILGRWKCGGR